MAFLGEDIKPIVFDLPGHGLTPEFDYDWSIEQLADQVIALADRLELKEFAYAGTSISGAVGYALALAHPKRLSSVSIICSAPKIGSPEIWEERISLVSAQGTASLVAATKSRWFTEQFASRKPAVVEELMSMLASTSKAAYLGACRALSGFNAWERLPEIKLPVLIVHGSEDPTVSLADAERANQLISDSGLIEISGVAHQAALEAPEVVMKHISFYARKFR